LGTIVTAVFIGPSPTPLPSSTLARPSPTPQPTLGQALKVATPLLPRVVFTPTPIIAVLPKDAIGWIEIPSVGIHAPIVEVSWHLEVVDGRPVAMWDTVRNAVGHHNASAGFGEAGNCVLSGHTKGGGGGVFQNLWDVQRGDEVRITDREGKVYTYTVEKVLKLREVGASLEERRTNARYMAPTDQEVLTLITCWPEWAYTHRVIVRARPQALEP